MSTVTLSTRWLTELDHVRLLKLAGDEPPDALAELLDVAQIVPSVEIASNVVTMNSKVVVTVPDTGEQRELTVCYPPDANVERGFISVLSPVGAALLGLQAGSLVTTFTPGGQRRVLRVDAILYQPESAGDYVT